MLESANCRMGTLEALNSRICGGVMPAGSAFSTVCEAAVTCASAALMFTFGWKKTFTTP